MVHGIGCTGCLSMLVFDFLIGKVIIIYAMESWIVYSRNWRRKRIQSVFTIHLQVRKEPVQ